MSHPHTEQIDTELSEAARSDQESVVELTRELVRIPSRGGRDPYDPVLDHMAGWLGERGLPCHRLHDSDGATVALTCEVNGLHPGPRYVLDTCLDTAPFGDEAAWAYPPTSGEVVDGWLHGRGSADSKAGAAIFAHLAARLRYQSHQMRGSVVLLFDVDEHTGNFGGAKAYVAGPTAPDRVDGVMIGYPGLNTVVIGGRGVLRARLHVYGVASHSGASSTHTPNAIAKATELVRALVGTPLPEMTHGFPLRPRLTITAIMGGEGYSTVPDLCTINVDVRLTPTLDTMAAAKLLQEQAGRVDAIWPGTQPTHLELTTSWPHYQLAPDEPLRTALLDATHSAGLDTVAKVAGPSNIGNYLAGLGIAATAGFGVDYHGLHGTDERIRIDSIPIVHYVYARTIAMLCGPPM